MKRAKKVSVTALSLVLSISFASGAMASNGKAKGLENAPGQSENFSKGITTEVLVTKNVTEEVRVDVETSTNSTTEPKSSSLVKIVEESVTTVEKHPTKNEYRDVITITIKEVTTTSTWDETTTLTTTTTTETPVTITETIETTIQHRGAPGSNGKLLLSDSVVIGKDEVKGDPLVSETSETTVTEGEVTSQTTSKVIDTKVERSGWKIGHNN
ncbi:hypothetical protein [Mesobacillus subterraneus]|uniref:G5 domain-containing protein n=1 Tax=Mesobacillus subterraneus TaxID=285983 RepID=A0A427TGZ8_9BACI|nr:hypothetical protein [Mesobacillus subterraneus]RSD22314.1 hypothetical protein EJA10_21430 [Mesobacillus subterraneus]